MQKYSSNFSIYLLYIQIQEKSNYTVDDWYILRYNGINNAGVAQLVVHLIRNQKVTCSSHATSSMTKDILWMSFVSYICLWQVILLRSYIRLRPVISCFAQFKGKYNITANSVCNITFDLSKISLNQRWNIT